MTDMDGSGPLSPEQFETLLGDLDISNNWVIDRWPIDRKRMMGWLEGRYAIPATVGLLLETTKALAVAQRTLAALPEERRPPGYALALQTIEDRLERITGHRAVNGAKGNELLPSITCPRCGRTSYHPVDIKEGYCAACNDWTTAKDS